MFDVSRECGYLPFLLPQRRNDVAKCFISKRRRWLEIYPEKIVFVFACGKPEVPRKCCKPRLLVTMLLYSIAHYGHPAPDNMEWISVSQIFMGRHL